jgi:hypothetical protein
LSSGKDAKALGEEGFEVGKNAKNNEKTENGEVFSNPKMKSPIFPSTASKVPQEVTQTHQTTDAPTIEPAVMKELKEVKVFPLFSRSEAFVKNYGIFSFSR